MKMRTFLVAGILCALSQTVLAAPPFEKILPDDTIAFITARNIPQLQARIKDQAVYALWNEPSVQRFLEKPLQRLTQELQKAEGQAGVKLSEIWPLFRGQAALVVSTDAQANEPEILLLADVGDQGPKAMLVIGALCGAFAEKLQTAALKPVEEQIEGVKFVRMQAPAPEGGAAAPEPAFTYGVLGDTLILGRPLSAVKRTAGFIKTEAPTALANAASYRLVLDKVSADSDFLAFVNVPRIVAIANQKAQGTQATQILGALGLNGLGPAGAAVTFGQDYSTSRIFLQTGGAPQGIVKILMPVPGPLHAGAEAPDDVASFISLRFDAAVIWDEVEKTIAAISPDTLTQLNAVINQFAQQLGRPFSLRNDILAVFGPRLAMYTRFEKPYNLMTSQQFVIMVDISSKAAFNSALENLQKVAPPMLALFQPREYLGHQVYVLTLPTPPGAPPAPTTQGTAQPAFVATDKEFIFSTRVEALEAHLRRMAGSGPSLQARPEFQEALKSLPPEARVMVGFADPVRQMEYFLTILKEGQFGPILGLLQRDPDVAEVMNLFDFSLLPDPAVVTKYLSPSATCAIVQPDGLLILSKSPTKPAK